MVDFSKPSKEFEKRSLAIVAMGNSHRDYTYHNFDKEIDTNVADDIWVINSAAFTFKHDLVVMMDDMQSLAENPKRAPYVKRIMREIKTPILSSRWYPEIPNIIEFPLADVINKFQFRYLNNSVAYGLAYALYLGYKSIILYGCDYMYDHKPGVFEKGRGCVEFWIAVGTFMCNAKVYVAQSSTLMDSNCMRFYGYREQPKMESQKLPDGRVLVKQVGWIPNKEAPPNGHPNGR